MPERGRDPGDYAVSELLKEVVLTGVAVVIPLVISLWVFVVAVNFIAGLLGPIANVLPGDSQFTRRVLAVGVIGVAILVVGFLAHFRRGELVLTYVDAAIERVPGVGTVYRSFRRMSDVMLEGDADHFREVKLVPFPQQNTYTFGFETAVTDDAIAEATGSEGMRTMFVPMGPNPFMGGHVLNVPEEELIDIDITVEEGIRAIVTSGVAVSDGDMEGSFEGPAWELSDFERVPDVSKLRDASLRRLDELDTERLDRDRLRTLESELKTLDIEEFESRLLRSDRDEEANEKSTEEDAE